MVQLSLKYFCFLVVSFTQTVLKTVLHVETKSCLNINPLSPTLLKFKPSAQSALTSFQPIFLPFAMIRFLYNTPPPLPTQPHSSLQHQAFNKATIFRIFPSPHIGPRFYSLRTSLLSITISHSLHNSTPLSSST